MSNETFLLSSLVRSATASSRFCISMPLIWKEINTNIYGYNSRIQWNTALRHMSWSMSHFYRYLCMENISPGSGTRASYEVWSTRTTWPSPNEMNGSLLSSDMDWILYLSMLPNLSAFQPHCPIWKMRIIYLTLNSHSIFVCQNYQAAISKEKYWLIHRANPTMGQSEVAISGTTSRGEDNREVSKDEAMGAKADSSACPNCTWRIVSSGHLYWNNTGYFLY